MNETELRSLIDTLTDQEFELLIRRYTGKHLFRLLDTEGSNKYYCQIYMWVTDVDDVTWTVKGIGSLNQHEIKGEVLSLCVDDMIDLAYKQKRNKFNLLNAPTSSTPTIEGSTEEIPF